MIFKFLLMSLLVYLVASADEKPEENTVDTGNGLDYETVNGNMVYEPDPDWEPVVENVGPEDYIGLGRYQYGDILFMTWIPHPIDKWDYVVVNASGTERHISETGTEELSTFTREELPDVRIVILCSEHDLEHYYNENLNVPVIGVDPFKYDTAFQMYLDNIFTIHQFANRPEMWAHFLTHPRAFSPVIERITREYGSYLEEWRPRELSEVPTSETSDREN